MQNATTSTIAQLLFNSPPVLNFARLVSDLEEGLKQCPCVDRKLSWDHDDIAIFDLDGSRITVSYSDDLNGQFSSCLNLSVGYGDNQDSDAPIGKRQGAVARMMADRISERFPPDSVQWLESDDVVTSDILDDLIYFIPDKKVLAKEDPLLTLVQNRRFAPVDLKRILDDLEERLEKPAPVRARRNDGQIARFVGAARARLDRRTTRAPSGTDRFVVANDTPHIPEPMLTEAQVIRSALNEIDDNSSRHSTELRLATHALNATMMVIAPPIGASMMTYSILRGENLHASARMLSIVGMLAGLQFTPIGAQVMSMF